MKNLQKPIHIIIACSVLACVPAPALAADDYMRRAEELFKASNFVQAYQYCEKEVEKNPTSCDAHYLKGSILFHWKLIDRAAKEFSTAADLDPKGQAGQYSNKFLQVIKASPSTSPDSDKSAPMNSSTTVPEQESNSTHDDKKANAEQINNATAEQIINAMSRRDQELFDQCKAETDRIELETEQQIQWAKSRMQADIAENGSSARRYNPEIFNQPIRAEYERQIDSLRSQGERRISDIKALYAARQSAVENSANGANQSYEFKNQQAHIKLSPVGSGLNVRNYETSGDTSHDEVPFIASPKNLSKRENK